MNKRPIDRTKKSNIKCEHCKYWDTTDTCASLGYCYFVGYMCSKHHEPKQYYQQCNEFEWKEEQ